MEQAVVVSAARTPVGKFGGSLKDISATKLGAVVINEAIKRANLKPTQPASWAFAAAVAMLGS